MVSSSGCFDYSAQGPFSRCTGLILAWYLVFSSSGEYVNSQDMVPVPSICSFLISICHIVQGGTRDDTWAVKVLGGDRVLRQTEWGMEQVCSGIVMQGSDFHSTPSHCLLITPHWHGWKTKGPVWFLQVQVWTWFNGRPWLSGEY